MQFSPGIYSPASVSSLEVPAALAEFLGSTGARSRRWTAILAINPLSGRKIAPDDFEVRLYLGIALLNLKRFVESEEQIRAALEKNQSAPTAHMYLGLALLSQNRLNEAQKELEESAGSKSLDVGLAHKYLGGIYWAQRDYKRAADELETYLRLMPKAADAEKTRVAIKDLRSRR
ncbi:MAG TPA: tetratricopeptide repeat protein [Pyrinomonadaceae bacterium]|nr:tetratricopeptide repeat protein [Pyrinomonadaceae bacterium]